MDENLSVICHQHGVTTLSMPPDPAVQGGVLRLSADCGCSTEFVVGDTEYAPCPEHEKQQILFLADCQCGLHKRGLLACGCQGALAFYGNLSRFIRDDGEE